MSATTRESTVVRQAGGHGVAASPAGRPLALAAVLLLVHAALQVAVNGIVLDETAIAAQIIAGSVRYDAGHPHAVFYPSAFSLPHYLAAGFWALNASTEFISASRNILFLFMSTFTAFALTYVLTRRAVWGYVAVGLVVAEANLRFAGTYPMWSFPNVYSNGHVGLQASVLVGALLIGGMWRSSGLLLGLLPGIHATYALFVWFWALLFMLGRKVYAQRSARRAILLWGGIGLTVSAAVFLLIRLMADTRPAVPPYDVVANGPLIREQFRIWTDGHRWPIPVRGFGYLANAVLFALLGILLWLRAIMTAKQGPSEEHPDWSEGVAQSGPPHSSAWSWQIAWIAGLGGMAILYVYGTRLWQALAPLPEAILLTMPSRFSNVTAVLLLPLLSAAMAASSAALDRRRRGLVFGLFALLLLAGGLMATNLVAESTRAVFSRNVFFVLLAILLGCEWSASSGRHRAFVAISLFAAAGLLFTYWGATKVSAYVLVTALGTVTLLGWPAAQMTRGPGLMERIARVGPARLFAPGLVILSLGAIPGRTRDTIAPETRWDMQSEETRAFGDWLSRNARPDEPVLTTLAPISELQLKTGQPVLFEHKTLWIMAYMPQLAPVIGTMARDLYGVDYENPEFLATACGGRGVGIWCPVWSLAWQQRSLDEWRTLGDKYRFRLVLAASDVPLNLPAVVTGNRWTLYAFE